MICSAMICLDLTKDTADITLTKKAVAGVSLSERAQSRCVNLSSYIVCMSTKSQIVRTKILQSVIGHLTNSIGNFKKKKYVTD